MTDYLKLWRQWYQCLPLDVILSQFYLLSVSFLCNQAMEMSPKDISPYTSPVIIPFENGTSLLSFSTVFGMGLPHFIHLEWLSLAFMTQNDVKRRDDIFETNCSQECRKLLLLGEECRLLWNTGLSNLIGSPSVLCNTERDQGLLNWLLHVSLIRIYCSVRRFSSLLFIARTLPRGLVRFAKIGFRGAIVTVYILFCDTVTPGHWFKPCVYRYAKGREIR
jgi:hypothetical protein